MYNKISVIYWFKLEGCEGMSLENLREEINQIDEKLLDLFTKRLQISREVALYKQEHNLPVFQAGREDQIIEKVRDNSPDEFKNSSEVLFKNIMDISKCRQQQEIYKESPQIKGKLFPPKASYKVGCPGTIGANSHVASKKLFPNNDINFYHNWENVFDAVENGEIDFGVLPIQNSTAGSVSLTYELMRKYNFYICASTSLKISSCLVVRKGTDISKVKKVFSHEQALAQCSEFIKENGYTPVKYANTALAAEFVLNSSEDIAAICSKDCADIMGLEIINSEISNFDENYTRFICISKDIYISDNANIISVSLSLSHTPGALYRLLTKFSVIGLNLLRIESKPIASKEFNVVFYLDFEGSINQPEVIEIIYALKEELEYFKFLGNYSEVN